MNIHERKNQGATVRFIVFFFMVVVCGFVHAATSMLSPRPKGITAEITRDAMSDATLWQEYVPKLEASTISEHFSLKDGATPSERARWSTMAQTDYDCEEAREKGVEDLRKKEATADPLYQDMEKNKEKRPRYRDVHLEDSWSNPRSRDVMANPHKVFEGGDCKEEPVYRVVTKKSMHTCRESVPITHHTCVRYLNKASRVEKEKVFNYTLYQWDLGHGPGGKRDSRKLPEFNDYWFEHPNWFYSKSTHVYSYQKRDATVNAQGVFSYGPWVPIDQGEFERDTPTTLEDVWVSDCEELEKRTSLGLCRKIVSKCTSKEKTRDFSEAAATAETASAGTAVTPAFGVFTRDCWQERHTYECNTVQTRTTTGTVSTETAKAFDTCATLRAKGCVQRRSRCLQFQGPECVEWESDLECMEHAREPTGKTKLVCRGMSYGMHHGINGETEGFDPNKDMLEVMAKLKTLSETAQYMSGGESSLQVFRGSRLQCKKDMMSFRDCCGGGGGWGVSMNLGGCGAEEQTLASQRSKGLCIGVGTYCAHREKFTKMCLSKKTSFCCFPTKLLKVIQEQGRRQLGLDFGDPKVTDCRGLTPDELSRIDFSRLNLREVEEELMASLNTSRMDESLHERLGQIQESLSRWDNKETLHARGFGTEQAIKLDKERMRGGTDA